MDTLVDGLIFILILGGLVPLSAVIKPWGPFPRRWIGLVIAFMAFMAGGILAQQLPSRPADVPQTEWDRRIALCREQQPGDLRSCVRDPAKLKMAEEAKAAAKANAPTPAAIKEAFLATHKQLLAAGKPCDDALQAASKTSGQYAGYEAAGAAEETCRQASRDIGALRFGDPIPEKAQKDLNDALECFKQAYGLRSVAMGQMAKVLDAGPSPSKVAAVRDSYRFAEETWQGCSKGYELAKLAYGFADIAPVLRAAHKRRTAQSPHADAEQETTTP